MILFARIAPQFLPLCQEPVELALSLRTQDGAIPTFLIGPSDEAGRRAAMLRGVDLYWGNTADADALARFYQALLVRDAAKYAKLIPVEWFCSRQDPDGSWQVPWYSGPYYGTRLCLDLLREAAPDNPACHRAEQFLSSIAREAGSLDLAVAEAHLDALLERQMPDGTWEPAPWIQMQMGRPTGRIIRTITWESRTITTAYCLRAISTRHLEELSGGSG